MCESKKPPGIPKNKNKSDVFFTNGKIIKVLYKQTKKLGANQKPHVQVLPTREGVGIFADVRVSTLTNVECISMVAAVYLHRYDRDMLSFHVDLFEPISIFNLRMDFASKKFLSRAAL